MINLYSDTQTRPTDAMRSAMASAEVGDEQRRADPTVEKLNARVAELLGKEHALFLPSGVMCNAIALKAHTTPGDAVICEQECHLVRAEAGGIGLMAGLQVEPLPTKHGRFTADEVRKRKARLLDGVYSPPVTLLCVEQTHNFAGGTVWPVEQLNDVTATAHELGMATHMDGARLLNAVVASGQSAAEHAAGFDSVWIDFSKGLGAPIGGVLAGSHDWIENKARRYKHMFGGAMRQAGILAAAALHALDHHVERLADDHANAKLLAAHIADIDGLELAHGEPQTNIVFFRTTRGTAEDFAAKCKQRGLDLSTLYGDLRAVTHLDVSRDDCERAGTIMAEVMRGLPADV
ncbi:MAG: threonine aldolase family protein [Planctomycetota bacterium]